MRRERLHRDTGEDFGALAEVSRCFSDLGEIIKKNKITSYGYYGVWCRNQMTGAQTAFIIPLL